MTDNLLVSAGIDNLFDRDFAEHLSRGGAMLSGYEQTLRVNEPGRTAWLRVGADFR
jgi:iron complex outermembrane receptor protein